MTVGGREAGVDERLSHFARGRRVLLVLAAISVGNNAAVEGGALFSLLVEVTASERTGHHLLVDIVIALD